MARFPLRVAFIGNSLPRRCGIATFTTDLQQAIAELPDIADTAIFAMRDPGSKHCYPVTVRASIDQDDPGQYAGVAELINRGGFDVVCLQHEFGIFGGVAGSHILELIQALRVPLVTTLHTVLDQPTTAQRAVMIAIVTASARVVVMAQKARDILIDVYGTDPASIVVIPHGIPEYPLVNSEPAKAKLGFSGKKIILTFGLLSPGKGIETMIDAMSLIIERSPDAVYVVMGATHPNLIREAGETYRHTLVKRVAALGLEGHVIFLNRFVDRPALLEHIAMSDVYVTPYLGETQMTSGTLAYSHGLGRPVVSTPYWHAAELLADGSGVLVPFSDPAALGEAVASLLGDAPTRLAMGHKAYKASRPMIWPNSAGRYRDCFRDALRVDRLNRMGRSYASVPAWPMTTDGLPAPALHHFLDMCDDTGLLQHAVHNVPDRDHGYCVDDNARALLLCCSRHPGVQARLPKDYPGRFAAFIQYAWNPDNGRFRNFMGYDRRWLEPMGSEDSHGRTLWALGACTRYDKDASRKRWAAGLFREGLAEIVSFSSPRAWAFTLLGLDDYCAVASDDDQSAAMRDRLAFRLQHLLARSEGPDWTWFEGGLAYDNARLCEALIRTGICTGNTDMIDAGLRSLGWLIALQKAPAGHFRPIGSMTFGSGRVPPLPFDQQPVEAAATIAACLAAHNVEPREEWRTEARRAFHWFLGENDLSIPLVDTASGSCRDGLHPDRANENRGAESVLAWLLGLADMHALEHARETALVLPVLNLEVAASSPIDIRSIS